MADIRVKDLNEATVPGADYYLLTDSATDGVKKVKTTNVIAKADIGLGNVDNTSDVNKPISTATQTALDLKADGSALTAHVGNTANPHGVTATQVGLGNVDNTSDATKNTASATLTNKTISGASNTLTVREADLSTSDVTTANVSTTKHGFAPKLPNDATKFLDGTGAYTVPAGGGGGSPDSAIFDVSKSPYNAVTGATDQSTAFASALAAAAAVSGILYIPEGSWTAKISAQDLAGFTIRGAGTKATTLTSPDTGPAIDCFSNVGSGNIHNFVIENLSLGSSSSTRTNYTLRLWNALHFTIRNVLCSGSAGVYGSGNFVLDNCEFYAGTDFGDWGGTLTSTGPGVVIAGQYQNSTDTAIAINGDILGVSFYGIMYSCTANQVSISIDGKSSGTPRGSVDFYSCHGESNFSSGNDGIDFFIGQNHKFGHVGFYGGNFWGHGNGTNYRLDWLRVGSCRDLVVDGVVLSNLGGTGYSGAGIRLVPGYPATGDTYRINGVQADISGSLLIDGAGVSSNVAGLRIFPKSLTGTNTNDSAPAGSVGEFQSSTVLVASAVSLTTNTQTNITSISLTAGDWDVWGNVIFSAGGSTVTTQAICGINTTSATLPTAPAGGAYGIWVGNVTGQAPGIVAGQTRISLASTTTIYLVAYGVFTTSTLAGYGFLGARRVR